MENLGQEAKKARKRVRATFVAKCIVDGDSPAVTTSCTSDGWFGVRVDGEDIEHDYPAWRVQFVNPKTGRPMEKAE